LQSFVYTKKSKCAICNFSHRCEHVGAAIANTNKQNCWEHNILPISAKFQMEMEELIFTFHISNAVNNFLLFHFFQARAYLWRNNLSSSYKKIKKEKDFILWVRRVENNKCWQEQKKCAYDRDILIKKEKEERKKRQNTKISSKTFLFEIILRYFDTLRSASLLFLFPECYLTVWK